MTYPFRQSLRAGNTFSPVPSSSQSTPEPPLLEKPNKPSRAFGERTQHFAGASRIPFSGRRITGPILTPLPEDSNAPQQIPSRGQLPTNGEDDGPSIVPGRLEELGFVLAEIFGKIGTQISVYSFFISRVALLHFKGNLC